MTLYLRDPSSLTHTQASGSSTSEGPSDSLDTQDTHPILSPYDPDEYNLSFQIVYTTSEVNPEYSNSISELFHVNASEKPTCHPVAMTLLLDTPLLIRFLIQEPPPPFFLLFPPSSTSFLVSLIGEESCRISENQA
jgi:hypothetical protein